MGTMASLFTGDQYSEGGSNNPTPQSNWAIPAGAPGFSSNNYSGGIDQSLSQALAGNSQALQTGAQQSQLANMLFGVANGTGPNPALQQLQQTTQANNAQAAGLIGSQRGISPALAMRLAATSAAANNQQAAGQGALMAANQQLGAMSQLGSTLANQQSGNLGLINANSGLLGTAGGLQGQQNQTQLGLQQLGQQNASQNAGLQQQAQGLNAGVAAQNTASGTALGSAILGGAAGGGGAALVQKVLGKAHGGVVPGHAQFPGNDPRNDTQPAMLSPGEYVVSREDAQDAKDFVRAIRSQKKSKNPPSYGKVLARVRQLEDEVAALKRGRQ
jgi:hypothetical protein